MKGTTLNDIMEDTFFGHSGDDSQKMASLHTNVFFCAIVAASWLLYFTRKDLFPDGSIPYMVLVGISFSITSVSMHALNKICVSLTNAPSTVTSIQMIMAMAWFMLLNRKEILEANREQLARWCIVPLAFSAMLLSSLYGYQYLTLTLVTVFRNIAPLITLLVERIVMPPEQRPTVTLPVLMSLFICVAGAVMFSWSSTSSSWIGLGLVALNTLLAIFDRLLQRRLLVEECKDLPVSACMAINNSLGLIPTFLLAFATHEVQHMGDNVATWTDPALITLLFMSGFMGLGIGVFSLMCQKAITATSMQVLHNSSKIVVVFLGVTIFGDQISNPIRFAGISLSLCGSAAYGYARALEQSAKKS